MSLPRHPLLIGGHRVETGDWTPIDEPATGTVIAEVAAAGRSEVSDAVAAALEAGRGWAALSPPERGAALTAYARLLDAHAEELAAIMSREMGKPPGEAAAEVARALEVVHYFAAEAERLVVTQLPGPTLATGSWTRPAPIGVVAAIVPWNFPVALVLWKLAPALAAGCPIVVKPAIEAPLAIHRLCELADEAGLPPGLVNCLTGDGPLIGEALSTHPDVAKVAFTGSRRVAEQIAAWAAPRLKAMTLELGGHGSLIVLPGADLDIVHEIATVQGFANAGQACYSVNRVIAEPGVADQVADRLADGLADLSLGPMATDRGVSRHDALLDDAREKGATVAGGGPSAGRRVEPAVITGAGPGVAVIDDEPFTPIVSVMEIAGVEAQLAEANRPDYGLVSYVVGPDMRQALEVAQQVTSGTVVINGWRVVVPYAPYGGWQGSGLGTELGRPGMDAFLRWQHLRVLA